MYYTVFIINRNIYYIYLMQIYFFLRAIKRITDDLCKNIQAKMNINNRINRIQDYSDYYYSKLLYQTIFVMLNFIII